MKLYSGPLSLFSKKIEIALAEKALAHERVIVPFSQTAGYAPKDPEVLAINPKAQVPVLIDGEVAVYDSTVILEYLEDAYPAVPLLPADPAARARCRLLDVYADEVMLAPLRLLMHRTEPGAAEAADWPEKEAAAARAEAVLAAQFARLDGDLAGQDWFLGAFSAADIALFMSVFWARRLGGAALAVTPSLAAWYARAAARPAFARMIEETKAADAELSAPVRGAFRDA